MDISEDCWEHVGLLQEVSAAEPPPPPPAPDFLIQQQEVSSPFLFLRSRDRALFGRYDSGEKSAGDWTRYSFFAKCRFKRSLYTFYSILSSPLMHVAIYIIFYYS